MIEWWIIENDINISLIPRSKPGVEFASSLASPPPPHLAMIMEIRLIWWGNEDNFVNDQPSWLIKHNWQSYEQGEWWPLWWSDLWQTFTRMGSMLPSMISLMVTYLYIVVNSSHKELAKNFHKDGKHVTKYGTLGDDLPAS